MPYVNKPRPYKKEYDQYHATPEQKKNRAERNAARAEMKKKEKVSKGDGNDVHHAKALSKGGTNGDGLSVMPAKKNRSFARKSDNSIKSEISKRERRSANS